MNTNQFHEHDLNAFIGEVTSLHEAIQVVNLKNIRFLDKANSLLDALSILNLQQCVPPLHSDTNDQTAPVQITRQLIMQIEQDARHLKAKLRHAAFQAVIKPENQGEFRTQISIRLQSLRSLLIDLHKEIKWENLPLFSYLNEQKQAGRQDESE